MRVVIFIAVGSIAAAVHMGVVLALVEWRQWTPPIANLAGWTVAFGVSFAGHFWGTFRASKLPWITAARRFWVISAAGFAINQLAYAAALRWTGLRYDGLLLLVLLAVAVMSYLMSRSWAFQDTPDRR